MECIRKGKAFLRLIYRKGTGKYNLIRLFGDESWIKKIKQCQNEIGELESNPNYLSRYMKHEISYWMNIPKWIFEDMTKRKVERVLDIGTAYGTLALFCKKIYDCEIYTIDNIESNISRKLFQKYNINFLKSNIELNSLPWDFNFDTIIFTEVIEHFNFHPLPTLKKIHSLLSPDGLLYFSTPDASEWGKTTKYYKNLSEIPQPKTGVTLVDDHVYQYHKKELLDLFEKADFKVRKFDYSPGWGHRHFNFLLSKKS